jgi:hypothetical protein
LEPFEILHPYFGTYRLVEAKYGDCPTGIQILVAGPSDDPERQQMCPPGVPVLTVGPYIFPALNLGKQKFEDVGVKGWSKSEASFKSDGEAKLEIRMERKWKLDSRKESMRAEVTLNPGRAEVEGTRKLRAPKGNHVHAHSKCTYLKLAY